MKVTARWEPPSLAEAKQRIAWIRSRFQTAGRALHTAGGQTFAAAVTAAAKGQEGPEGVAQAIASAAARHDINPAVLWALAQCESGLRPEAVSPRGAMGLMQLMPETAGRLGVADPFDVGQNVEAGARYLRQQLDQFGGDLALALAAYNAGPGAVTRYGGIPPYAETEQFVSRVLSLIPHIELASRRAEGQPD